MAKHIEPPFFVMAPPVDPKYLVIEKVTEEGEGYVNSIPVCTIEGFRGAELTEEQIATAFFIIAATNNYYPMLEALEKCLKVISMFGELDQQRWAIIKEAKTSAREAIANAKELLTGQGENNG